MSAFRDVRKGPGDLPGDSTHPNSPDYDNSADEARGEAIDELLNDPKWRAAHKAEADSWCDGMHDGEWYSQAESRMADLDGVEPMDLPGSNLLASLYALAKTAAAMRNEKLREIAENEVDSLRDAA